MIIAFSGPAAAGKGTLAKMLAKKFNLPHYDFGLMFRAIAALSVRFGFAQVPRLIRNKHLKVIGGEIFLGQINLTLLLRKEEFGLLASQMANNDSFAITKVAQTLVVHKNFVCDGRTCGSEIYPDAEFKFYITAEENERIIRRLKDNGKLQCLLEREKIDKVRLKIPNNAIIINTTGKSRENSFREILLHLKQLHTQ